MLNRITSSLWQLWQTIIDTFEPSRDLQNQAKAETKSCLSWIIHFCVLYNFLCKWWLENGARLYAASSDDGPGKVIFIPGKRWCSHDLRFLFPMHLVPHLSRGLSLFPSTYGAYVLLYEVSFMPQFAIISTWTHVLSIPKQHLRFCSRSESS